MGASNSRPEEDKSLKLCYDRMKFVKKAIGCRCVLAESHFIYIQSLKDTGRILLEFFDPQIPIESDLHDSTDANKEPLMPNKTHSNEGSGSPQKTKDIVAPPVDESVTVPTEKEKHDDSVSVSAPSPWDYFDLFHPGYDQISSQKINGCPEGLLHRVGDTKTSLNAYDERNANESNLKSFEIEEENEIDFVLERNVSIQSDKDCDEPLSEGVLGGFGNLHLTSDILDAASSPSIVSISTEISEIFPIGRSQSPDLSPLREIAPSVSEVVNLTKLVDVEEMDIPVNTVEEKVSLKALYLSMKDIDQLFFEASESGQEVLSMLEANKLHFDRPVQKQKGESKRSWCLITCFCHEDEAYQVSRELGQASKRHLTSQRHMSARSFSSIASQNPRDDSLGISSNDIYCMRAGSHVSSLERLYAWEKKLYDEVKASTIVRRKYDQKCKLLGHQEFKAESAKTVDKTRAIVKDLHSSIRVSIKRMKTISSTIIRIRDSELQPQFEELIKGLGNMWHKMHEFHKRQFDIISATLSIPPELVTHSDDPQRIKNHLEQLLSMTSSNYTRLIISYQSYLKEIEGWLLQCFSFPEKSSKKTSKHQHTPISEYYPPILITCRSWLEGLEKLAAEASNISSCQDIKRHGENTGDTNNLVDKSHKFCTKLVQIFSQLMTVSESSTKMYTELEKSIQEASRKYEQLRKRQPS